MIVLDPRVSDQAENADIHLRLKAGTDAAMCLGWLKVIFDEGLYDEVFVRDWCVGFDELKQRVDEYPLARVADITGVAEEDIAAAARMYANANGAVIPWTPITDQQLSSTSAIRLHSILRAVTGNLDVAGGEMLGGFSESYIPESELGLHERLPEGQKEKQLGFHDHPVFTYRVAEMLKEPTQRTWGFPYADLVMGCHMANPTNVFRAMALEDPYPIKAFFCLGNNALLELCESAPDLSGPAESRAHCVPRDFHDADRDAGGLRVARRCLFGAESCCRRVVLGHTISPFAKGSRRAERGE